MTRRTERIAGKRGLARSRALETCIAGGLAVLDRARSAKPASENHAFPRLAWAFPFSIAEVEAALPLAIPA